MANSKVAVVSGSNKGLGYEIVRALCSKFDGDVYLTSRNEERGKEAVKQLESEGLKVKYHQLDIDDMESVTLLNADMVSLYGGIDVLINNAGIQFGKNDPSPFSVQAAATLKTNFFNTLQASKILLPNIKENGRVVNVSSLFSKMYLAQCSSEIQNKLRRDDITEEQLLAIMNEFVSAAQDGSHVEKGWPGYAYAVSKIGVTVMSKIHAEWLQKQGKNSVLLNACCPGWLNTEMGGSSAPKTAEQGADTPVYLALLPTGAVSPNGKLVIDRVVEQW